MLGRGGVAGEVGEKPGRRQGRFLEVSLSTAVAQMPKKHTFVKSHLCGRSYGCDLPRRRWKGNTESPLNERTVSLSPTALVQILHFFFFFPLILSIKKETTIMLKVGGFHSPATKDEF